MRRLRLPLSSALAVMSIEQPHIIDAIGTEIDTGVVVLTISDHLEWNREHLLLLQEKINTYLAFIESNEIYSTYPDAFDRKLAIEIRCKYRPDSEATEFLSKVSEIVKSTGVNFIYEQ
jgi:urate oxidase